MEDSSVTSLLALWRNGDDQALERLTPLIYSELRRLASAHFKNERGEHTLQPTALVHEAYLKLAALDRPDWENRVHFLAAASRLMRQVLVDHSRRRDARKRGGGARHEPLDDAVIMPDAPPRDVLALDDALEALAGADPAKCRMIELRYFGGLTGEEIAYVMGISHATVTRGMRTAEAWLARELKGQSA